MSEEQLKRITIDQLKQMGVLKKAADIERKKVEKPSSLLEIYPNGEFVETPFKEVFKVTEVFDLQTDIGIVKIREMFDYKDDFPLLLSILGRNETLKKFKLDQLLFFDVESTGLSSGAGNMVFMIGLGYFNKKKEFIIDQFFIEDYINEKGLLYILEQFFKKYSHLISFNGKCFDFHVLKNRFILSRKFSFELDNLLHFDLLHPSRRMWNSLLEQFNLGHLEKEILQFFRTDEDLPGYLVPEYYKDYLKSHNANIVKKIFYHNLMDIRSMLGLMIIQMKNIKMILNRDFPENINHCKIADLICGYDRDTAKELLNYCYQNIPQNKMGSIKQLYFYYKRERDVKKMESLLKEMIESSESFDYFPYQELSKLYEHTIKDYDKAIKILNDVENRLEQLNKLHFDQYIEEMDDVIKRFDRIKKRCSKK